MKGWVSLHTKNNGKELWAESFFEMWECPDNLDKINGDKTYGSIRKKTKLTTVDNGWYIKTIKDATVDRFQYIDKARETENVSGGGPVLNYKILGDTNGHDLGSSYIEITFKPIAVTLEKTGDCIRNPNKKPTPKKATLSFEPVKLKADNSTSQATNLSDKVLKTKPKTVKTNGKK